MHLGFCTVGEPFRNKRLLVAYRGSAHCSPLRLRPPGDASLSWSPCRPLSEECASQLIEQGACRTGRTRWVPLSPAALHGKAASMTKDTRVPEAPLL